MNFERIRLNKMIGKLKKVLRIGYEMKYICPVCDSELKYVGYGGEPSQENVLGSGERYKCTNCNFRGSRQRHHYSYRPRHEILEKYDINELSKTYQTEYSEDEDEITLIKELRKV